MTLVDLIQQCTHINNQLNNAHISLINPDGTPFEIESLEVASNEDLSVSHIIVHNSASLRPGTYAIPEDCTFKYANRQIIIVPKKTKDTSILRCATCKHIRIGRKCCKDQFWDTQYCLLKPKTIGGKTEYFYHVSPSTKACDQYEEA